MSCTIMLLLQLIALWRMWRRSRQLSYARVICVPLEPGSGAEIHFKLDCTTGEKQCEPPKIIIECPCKSHKPMATLECGETTNYNSRGINNSEPGSSTKVHSTAECEGQKGKSETPKLVIERPCKFHKPTEDEEIGRSINDKQPAYFPDGTSNRLAGCPPLDPWDGYLSSDPGGSIGRAKNYTDGPAKIEYVDDGVKACGALLLKLELSEMIVRAIRCQQRYLIQKARTNQQIAEIESFEKALQPEIAEKALELEEAIEEQTRLDGKENQNITRLQDQVQVLQQMQNQMEWNKLQPNMKLSYWADELQEMAGDVIVQLDKIFVEAFMVGPEDLEADPLVVYDWDVEWMKAYEKVDRESPVSGPPPVPTPGSNWEDEVVDPRYEISSSLQMANIDRKQARRDLRVMEGSDRGEEWRSQLTNGWGLSREEFDSRWDAGMKEATQSLSDAEQALEKAKAAAKEAGLDMENYPSDDSRDGCSGTEEE